jgi:hypothetical protein
MAQVPLAEDDDMIKILMGLRAGMSSMAALR